MYLRTKQILPYAVLFGCGTQIAYGARNTGPAAGRTGLNPGNLRSRVLALL
jgi:hypothetical protein